MIQTINEQILQLNKALEEYAWEQEYISNKTNPKPPITKDDAAATDNKENE